MKGMAQKITSDRKKITKLEPNENVIRYICYLNKIIHLTFVSFKNVAKKANSNFEPNHTMIDCYSDNLYKVILCDPFVEIF